MNNSPVSPSTSTRGSYSAKTTLRIAILVTITVIASVLLGVQPASAAQYSYTAGRLGPVSMIGPMLTVYDTRQIIPPYIQFPLWQSGGLKIGRSPASANPQLIGVTYQLETYGSQGWVALATSRLYSGRASGTARVSFPSWRPSVNKMQFTQGYRITLKIGWVDTHTNRRLAAAIVVPSLASDNVCATAYIACSSHWDGVSL